MRLTGQVRREQSVKTPLSINSAYKVLFYFILKLHSIRSLMHDMSQPIDRPSRRFNPLKVPRKLQAALPFASKPKIMKPQSKQTYMQKRAVVLEPEEKRAITVLQQIRALRKDQVIRRKEKQAERKADHGKKVAKIEALKEEKKSVEKKDHMRKMGQKAKMDSEEGGSRKRHKSK
jgi:ribosome biogenesis protein BMS1